jgi:predicted transcriptional regulator
MRSSRSKLHVTSVRLDEWQLSQLHQLQRLNDRSVSWLIQRAIDSYVEDELSVSRAAHEAAGRAREDADVLASFKPRSFRMPLVGERGELEPSHSHGAAAEPSPEDLLDQRIQSLLDEHGS